MLKRQQVLLSDWLVDYIKFLSEKFDLSFSEVIRGTLSLQFLNTISTLYPKHKPALSNNEISKILLSASKKKQTEEELRRLISKIYFEARKAIEFRLAAARKEKK